MFRYHIFAFSNSSFSRIKGSVSRNPPKEISGLLFPGINQQDRDTITTAVEEDEYFTAMIMEASKQIPRSMGTGERGQ